MYKKFTLTVLISVPAALLLTALIVYLVDPFVHFHAPFGKLAPVETNEYYQNTGVARNLDYDMVVAGSSMSENFQASWFNHGFDGKTVKLTFQGGQLVNYKILFDEIFKHQEIDRLFFPLDNFILTDSASSTAVDIPDYLYGTGQGSGLWTSLPYLLSKDILIKYIPKYLLNNITNDYSADTAYTWGDKFHFSIQAALNSYNRHPEELIEPMKPDTYYYDNADVFLETMLPYITEHPDTEFYIWFPPYSVLFWDDANRHGSTDAEISAQAYVTWNLLQYPNVKVFYFQNLTDIVTDLNNYKDYSHYTPAINYYIYQSFRDEKHMLSSDNYHEEFMKTKHLADTFDFRRFFR